MKKTKFGLPFLVLCACAPSPNEIRPEVTNAIAACSGSIELSDSVEAKLALALTDAVEQSAGAELSAKISQSVRGIAFTEEGLQNENTLKAYELYDACIRDKLERLA